MRISPRKMNTRITLARQTNNELKREWELLELKVIALLIVKVLRCLGVGNLLVHSAVTNLTMLNFRIFCLVGA